MSQSSAALIDTTTYTVNRTNVVNLISQIGNNLVHLQLVVEWDADVPTTAFAIIPSGFRPPNNIYVPAIITTSQYVTSPYAVAIGPNGLMVQNFTSLMRKIYIDAMYKI